MIGSIAGSGQTPGQTLGQAWLVPFADMALILFVFTAAGMANTAGSGMAGQRETDMDAEMHELGEGVASAVFVDSAQAPPLGPWLASHPLARGEQLTILCQYSDATMRSNVAARCETLASEAAAQGQTPRVIVQAGPRRQVIAYFAADREALLARGLHSEGQT